ncbi:MAG: Zn-ribbon domain-containing OB-fold protein [Thermoplasmata archaeon]
MTEAEGHSIADYQTGYTDLGRLRGFACRCGFRTATWVLACPRCGARSLTDVDLSGRGRVVACSVQHVPSDEFLNEAPYAYVVVELPEGGRITGWVAGVADPADLPLGTAVHFHPSYKPGVQFVRD